MYLKKIHKIIKGPIRVYSNKTFSKNYILLCALRTFYCVLLYVSDPVTYSTNLPSPICTFVVYILLLLFFEQSAVWHYCHGCTANYLEGYLIFFFLSLSKKRKKKPILQYHNTILLFFKRSSMRHGCTAN